MGTDRRLLGAAVLVLVAALAAAGPLAAPEKKGQAEVQTATSETPAEVAEPTSSADPALVKTAGDAAPVKTGSDGTETADPATGQATDSKTQSKIYGSNTASETFFTYGAALTGLIYGLMGVGYFYGPYSREAFLAQQRAELRKQYLQQLTGTTPTEHDYGHYAAEEADALSGGLYGQIQVPAQYTITRREDAADRRHVTQPEYAAEHWYQGGQQQDGGGAFADDRYQLVMARGDPAGGVGVNRRGGAEVIPIRLPRQSGPQPQPVVSVLDMQSSECRAWVACLQNRSQRMLQQHTGLSPTEFDPSCEQFVNICPTQARSLDQLKQQ